ncbi:hypothetical protein HPP92_017983 [Vanilla planifolia]|uniref:C2H2-type domain-containing protein n=1 Tax=Vanilla planifolia TaxID=51239 RepID=A0A835UM07_VANPL|nr:hypothetical protein HPP92_017983 [Vanilla planifolia]
MLDEPPHSVRRSKQLLFTCGVCSKSFASKKALFGHQRVHPKNKIAIRIQSRGAEARETWASACYCRKGVAGENWEVLDGAYVLSCMSRSVCDLGGEEEQSCLHCAFQRFDREHSVRRRICMKQEDETVKGSEAANKYKCKQCLVEFDSFQALGGHCASHNNKARNGNGEAVKEETVVRKTYPCDKCDEVFDNGRALGGHKRKHYTGPELRVCRKQSSSSSNGELPDLESATGASTELVVLDFDLNLPAEP